MTARTAAAVALGLGLAWSGGAIAQETVKIGVILPYSGPVRRRRRTSSTPASSSTWPSTATRSPARRSRSSARTPAARTPDVAKRLAQELVVRDGVDILAGFALTPEALGAADVATEARS